MNVTLFIAKKLKLGNNGNKKSSLTLNIAVIGISLAIVIMIISMAIVNGFKNEISSKIYELNPQIEISNYNFENINSIKPISLSQFDQVLEENGLKQKAFLYSQKSVVLKTDNDYMGITLNGYDNGFNNAFLESNIKEGKLPSFDNKVNNEIAISEFVADKLNLSVGDKITAFFINDKVKARKLIISGIFNTNFDDFDKNIVIGNQALIRGINKWDENEGTTIGISNLINEDVYIKYNNLYSRIQEHTYKNDLVGTFYITNIEEKYASFFEWLKLLDSNIIIILTLMAFVSIFTLISGLLIIILERIDTIGTLKAIGTTNGMIRNIFIFLAQKIVFKAVLLGNAIALILCFIQSVFKIIKLDASSYFMNYVPIDIELDEILILNICIIIIAVLALIIPSYVITSITPAKSIKYE